METPKDTSQTNDTTSTSTKNLDTDSTKAAKYTEPKEPFAFTKHFETTTKLYNGSDLYFKQPIFADKDNPERGNVASIFKSIETLSKALYEQQKQAFSNNDLERNFYAANFEDFLLPKINEIQNKIQTALDNENIYYKIMDGKDKLDALNDLKGATHKELKSAFKKIKEEIDTNNPNPSNDNTINDLKNTEKSKWEEHKNKLIAEVDKIFKDEIRKQARLAEAIARQRNINLFRHIENGQQPPGVSVTGKIETPEPLQDQSLYKIVPPEDRNWINRKKNIFKDKSIYATIDGDNIILEARSPMWWKSSEGRLAIRRQLQLRIAKKGFSSPLKIEATNGLGKSNHDVLKIMFEEAIRLGFDPASINGFSPKNTSEINWVSKLIHEVNQTKDGSSYSKLKKHASLDFDKDNNEIIKANNKISETLPTAEKNSASENSNEERYKKIESKLIDYIEVNFAPAETDKDKIDKDKIKIKIKDKARELLLKTIDELNFLKRSDPSDKEIQANLAKQINELIIPNQASLKKINDSKTDIEMTALLSPLSPKEIEAYKQISDNLSEIFIGLKPIEVNYQRIETQINSLTGFYDQVESGQFTNALLEQYDKNFTAAIKNITDLLSSVGSFANALNKSITEPGLDQKIGELGEKLQTMNEKIETYQLKIKEEKQKLEGNEIESLKSS